MTKIQNFPILSRILDGEAIGTKLNQKLEQTKNPAFLQDLEDSTLQGIFRFATGTLSIANTKILSSPLPANNLRAMEVGEVASPEPQWRTGASLLSTPMAGLLYQG